MGRTGGLDGSSHPAEARASRVRLGATSRSKDRKDDAVNHVVVLRSPRRLPRARVGVGGETVEAKKLYLYNHVFHLVRVRRLCGWWFRVGQLFQSCMRCCALLSSAALCWRIFACALCAARPPALLSKRCWRCSAAIRARSRAAEDSARACSSRSRRVSSSSGRQHPQHPAKMLPMMRSASGERRRRGVRDARAGPRRRGWCSHGATRVAR